MAQVQALGSAAAPRAECAVGAGADRLFGVGVEWRALGPVEALVGGCLVDLGPPKQRALFALLLSRVDRPVAVDTLIEELWAGTPPAAAAASLLAYVSNLRRVLEPYRAPRAPATVLRTRAPGYLLDSRGCEFDVRRFVGHATAGRQALARADVQQALVEFDAALALWRGEAYADVRDAGWVAPEVARLEQLRLSVIEGRAGALLKLGAHDVAVAELEVHVQAHPLREHGCQLLALALYRAGRQAEALAVLRATRTRLAEQLGIDPGTALQRLEQDILIHAPVLDCQHAATLPVPATVATQSLSREPTGVAPQRTGDEVFVGRQSALQRLFDALGAVAAGQGRVVAVAGEPGIGKTRLLRRFAELAGAPVICGACPEHLATPPLWPWEQVLRAVRTRWPQRAMPSPVAELLEGHSPDLSEVFDVAGAALRRFEAIEEYLAGGADGSPLVVVIDDLHWADIASLRLLTHLAQSVAAVGLLLVGSYRPYESGALVETLAALTRAGAERIELTGLATEEAAALVQAMAGGQVSARTAVALWARTEGNPFFLRELVRLLASERRLDEAGAGGGPVPLPVREVVLRRIARLPEAAAALVSMAAVAGRDFDLQVVAEAASVDVEAALEAIDAAVAAGLVVEDEQRLGWFRFTHALIAEALYEVTGRLRRVRRHRRIGQAAAEAWRGHDERTSEIARHWLLAAELDRDTAAQASVYAAAAARAADARLAPEDAADLWQQALAAAELAGDDVDLYPLLMGLATSLYRAGNIRDGLPVFVQAIGQALAETSPDRTDHSRVVSAAVAAMGEWNWFPVNYGMVDQRLVTVLQQALARVTDPLHRALVLSCLAVARYYDDAPEERQALTDEALALAHPAADDVSLAHVLHLRAMALYTPDYPEQCLQATTELLNLRHVPPPLMAAARLIRTDFLVMRGRIPEAAAELDLVATIAEQLRSQPLRTQLTWSRAGLLLLAGRWQQADELSQAALDLNARISWVGAHALRIIQRWEAAYLADTGVDLIDELRAEAQAFDLPLPALYNIQAIALAHTGRAQEARAVLRRADARKDYMWLHNQCWSLLAAARLGETELVARLRDQLLAYRHLACVAGSSVAVSGSVAYFTAEAALALGDPDGALADLAIAVEMDQRMGALPWLAQARDAISRAQRLRQGDTKSTPGPGQAG